MVQKSESRAFSRGGGGGRRAYTWSNTSVKEKVGLSEGGGGLYIRRGLQAEKYSILFCQKEI